MKLTNLTIFCLFFTASLYAQEPLTPRGSSYFFLGLGLPIIKVRDEGHSPLIYNGLNTTFRIGYERLGTDVVSRFAVSFSVGEIKPKTRPEPAKQLSKAEISTVEISYAYYRRIGNAYLEDDVNRYFGGALSFLFDGRSYNLPSNNLFGYQGNFSLNAGGFFMKKMNNTIRMNDEIFTPLLTFAMRPNYIGLMPVTTTDFSPKNILKTGKFVTVNKVFRLYNRFSFDEQSNDHRRRRLAYSWDGQVNNVSRPLRAVSAGLTYESLFKM
jgi:hypothetical protein